MVKVWSGPNFRPDHHQASDQYPSWLTSERSEAQFRATLTTKSPRPPILVWGSSGLAGLVGLESSQLRRGL